MSAREVKPGIFEIDTKPLGHEKIVAAYFIRGSKATALIDTGFPVSADTVARAIEETGCDPEKIGYIILTHSHIDHSGAAGKLAAIAGNGKIAAHKRGVFYLKNSMKIFGGSKMVFGELSDTLGQPVDTPEERIIPLEEGDTIDLGDRVLSVLSTPGHSGDHISLFEKSTGTLFTGDTACIHYPQLGHLLIPAGSPPIYRSDYIMAELDSFQRLHPATILTPHFGEAHLKPVVFLSENIKAVKDSKAKIDELFKAGMEFPQVVEKLRSDILGEVSGSGGKIPQFLSEVWLRLMLKTGLMGFMADILKYARDIRPFH
ncbi:MAG: MBL fold metallo-hydrolase [Spirochaetota bacterium]